MTALPTGPLAPTRIKVSDLLPPMLADDPMLGAFAAAIGEALEPATRILESLDAYVDLHVAPADTLRWLSSWWGLHDVADALGHPDEAPDVREWRLRTLLADAGWIHRSKGTLGCLEALARLALDPPGDGQRYVVGVLDSGGSAWSTRSRTPPPGSGPASVTIVVDGSFDEGRLRRAVDFAVPAGVTLEIERFERSLDAPRSGSGPVLPEENR